MKHSLPIRALAVVIWIAGAATSIEAQVCATASCTTGVYIEEHTGMRLDLKAGTYLFLERSDSTWKVAASGTYRISSDTVFLKQPGRVPLIARRTHSGLSLHLDDMVVDFHKTALLPPEWYTNVVIDEPAKLLPGNPVPRYPQALRTRGIHGEVVVQFVVDTLGCADLSTFTVVQSPNPLLSKAVRDVLPKYRFSPAKEHGAKVRQLIQMPVTFSY